MKTSWTKWFGAGARRLQLVEGQIQALRSEWSAQSERALAESGRAQQQLALALGSQGERLSETERRLQTGEGEVRALRSELAAYSERVAMESERIQQMMPALNAQSNQLTDIERRMLAAESGIQSMIENLLAAEEKMSLGNEEITRLRTMLLRLELQQNANADEVRRIATGLLERIERARLGSEYGRPPPASAADGIT